MFAKYQYSLGLNELAKGTEVSAYEAVKSFYDGLETFLFVLAEEKGEDTRHIKFNEYPGRLEKVYDKPFINAQVVKTISMLRTPYKHSGIYPNREAVKELVEPLRDLFEENARNYLNVSFSDVSLSDVIRTANIRDKLRTAETLLEESRYEESLIHSRVAFHFLENLAQRQLPVHAEGWLDLPKTMFDDRAVDRALRDNPRSELITVFREANRVYEKVRDIVRLLAIGADPLDYARFEYVTPIVHFMEGGNWKAVRRGSPGPLLRNRETARFGFEFVLDLAMRIESVQRVPDSWSFFKIRVLRDSPLYTFIDRKWTEVERVAAGQEIDQVHAGFVIGEGGFWLSGEKDNLRHLSMDRCEVVEESPYREFWGNKRKEGFVKCAEEVDEDQAPGEMADK